MAVASGGNPLVPVASEGFLGDIVGAVGRGIGGFVTGGPVGAIGAVVGGSGGRGARVSEAARRFAGTGSTLPGLEFQQSKDPCAPFGFCKDLRTNPFTRTVSCPGGCTPISGERVFDEPAAQVATNGECPECPKGFHKNKTRYFDFTEMVVVEPNTRCVKNRRTNPANGAAAIRGLRRVSSTHALLKRTEKQLRRLASRSGVSRRPAARAAVAKCGCK